jgi:predicted Zn-dependent peptidase
MLGSAWLACLLSLPAQESGDSAFRYPLHEFTLDNGMRVLIVEQRDVPRVHGSLWWRVGSVHERPGATGLSHFFEHMMFMGTDVIGTTDPRKDAELNAAIEQRMSGIREIKLRRLEAQRRGAAPDPADEARFKALWKEYEGLVAEQKGVIVPEHLSKIFQAHGGTGLNATTSYDRTNYFVELPANKVELFCWLESDRFLKPVFRSFYPEREVVKEERRMRTDSTPTGLVNEAFMAQFWQAHSYRWPVIGWMSDIDQYTLADAEAYYKAHYTPENCTAVFVGDVQVAPLKEQVKRYFGRLPRRTAPREPVVTVEPDQAAERRLVAEVDAADDVGLRWHAPAAVHADAAALDLLTNVLAGRSGRLYGPLVEQRKLALDVEAWYWGLRYGGAVQVGAQPREGVDPLEVEKALLELVAEVQAKGVTDRELQKAKNQSLADFARRMRTNSGIAQQLGYWETVGTVSDFFASLKAAERVTAADLQRVAQVYLKPSGRNVLILKRKAKK